MAIRSLFQHRLVRALLPPPFRAKRVRIPVVRLQGAIGAVSPLWPGLSLATVAGVLERAFEAFDGPAVALVINSPGGSAVQSRLIHDRIRALAGENNKTVFAFVEDVAASGGYMLACAGDEIVADASSIIGSIGVISAGFGFEKLIDKLGIERRVFAAGKFKGMLDPFQPLDPEEAQRLRALQDEVHRDFIALVERRRAGKLNPDGIDLFTGEFWTGGRAKALGLIDGIGDIRSVIRERFGDKAELKPLTPARGLFGRRTPAITANLPGEALFLLEERMQWTRYGL